MRGRGTHRQHHIGHVRELRRGVLLRHGLCGTGHHSVLRQVEDLVIAARRRFRVGHGPRHGRPLGEGDREHVAGTRLGRHGVARPLRSVGEGETRGRHGPRIVDLLSRAGHVRQRNGHGRVDESRRGTGERRCGGVGLCRRLSAPQYGEHAQSHHPLQRPATTSRENRSCPHVAISLVNPSVCRQQRGETSPSAPCLPPMSTTAPHLSPGLLRPRGDSGTRPCQHRRIACRANNLRPLLPPFRVATGASDQEGEWRNGTGLRYVRQVHELKEVMNHEGRCRRRLDGTERVLSFPPNAHTLFAHFGAVGDPNDPIPGVRWALGEPPALM